MSDITERFKKIKTATISDTLRVLNIEGTMSFYIKPMTSEVEMVGMAFTVKTSPGNILTCLKALEEIQAGEVVLIDTGNCQNYAYLGEQMCTDAKRFYLGFHTLEKYY